MSLGGVVGNLDLVQWLLHAREGLGCPTTHLSHCSNHFRSCLHFLSPSVNLRLSRQLSLQDLGKIILDDGWEGGRECELPLSVSHLQQ